MLLQGNDKDSFKGSKGVLVGFRVPLKGCIKGSIRDLKGLYWGFSTTGLSDSIRLLQSGS